MNKNEKVHLWQGEWLSDAELDDKLPELSQAIQNALSRDFEIESVLSACEKLSLELENEKSSDYQCLNECLKNGFSMEEKERAKELKELAAFLKRSDLEAKLIAELGAVNPFNFSRSDFRKNNFEKWAPLGFLVHIAPTNAYSAGAWSLLEGLISGNVNFLKTGGSDQLFAQLFLKLLIEKDETDSIAARIFACRISSSEQAKLKAILKNADAVIVWGDEGAISGVRAISPPHARFIEWGPKISFAYFASESLNDKESLQGLAREICRMEQQACSSPQCVFVELESPADLRAFGERLAVELAEASKLIAPREASAEEQAEISLVLELCRQESCLDLSEIIEDENGKWRIMIEYSSRLKASPLYRSIWLKPIRRKEVLETLRPFRHFLQTAGLAAGRESLFELSELLTQSGVLRLTACGEMLESYSGEPHDGVFALQRYTRKLSAQLSPKLAEGLANFADLKKHNLEAGKTAIMSKEDFQSQNILPEFAELFFKSGGSSGEPKLSVFTYQDYHLQMQAAAEGLFAAGLDLKLDRCMNLFFAGGLYGGFLSFFTILEYLKAVQFPMAGISDLQMVAETIVKQRVNVILGMPSYILQLFSENSELLKKSGTIEKVFYAGEHFSESQIRNLKENFGVKLVSSCGYGSVDAGPIGFQCRACSGSIHHLHSRLHLMEIVELDADIPVKEGEVGRVLLSSLARHGQNIKRYEIGDLARILPGRCPCLRLSPRFELLGRHGDVFRIASAFFNYSKFLQILGEERNYSGELQIDLEAAAEESPEKIILKLNAEAGLNPDDLRTCLLSNYKDLAEIVEKERLLELGFRFLLPQEFLRSKGSGKLKHIIDSRGH
ncbi:MAG: hypothetical protein K2X27_16445 [Candidatus Obscuribacterales bacterium]|nr:hypothetical protein [Candidatus Obscuribacterales bacterium]